MTDQAVRAELVRALALLGSDPEIARTGTKAAILEAAQRRKADPVLLATIGSWGETLDGEAVIAGLRRWIDDTIGG